MPTYKVKDGQKGFYGGALYGAGTPRKTLTVDKPFAKKEMPSWVEPEPMKEDGKSAKKSPAKKSKKSEPVVPDFTAAESGPAVETTVETL